MDSLVDTTNPNDGGTAITNQGLRSTTPVVDNGGGKANSGAAGKARTPKAHFTANDCARLIHARTILDHHYDQRINSAQTKMQFVTDKYNHGFDVPAKFVDGAANDIHFDPLLSKEHKTEVQLQRKWESMTKSLRDILISSQEQTILNEITRRTHAKGEKRDAG